MPDTRGGTSIFNCVDPDKAYELVDETTTLAYRQNFGDLETRGLKPVITDVGVFVYSYIVSNKFLRQLVVSGIEITASNIYSLAAKSGGSGLLATVLLSVSGSGVI